MISYLKGKIIYQALDYIILDVNGVGYKIQFKIKNLKLKIGDAVDFWLYHHIRENEQSLYGFKTREELNFFELLLKVNGVGPKMAMNILSKNTISNIKNAVEKGDINLLTTVGGIGKKIAGKIIVELKNKIGGDEKISFDNPQTQEVVSALTQLGYKKEEIIAWVGKIPDNIDSSHNKVRWLLQHFNKK